MSARCLTPYYRNAVIAAFTILMALSGNFAFADGDADVQPQKEDSKKSDQQADKADKTSDKVAEPTTAAVQPAEPAGEPVYHRLQLRLSGSMCAACLKDLQDKLLKIAGIEKIKVDRPNQSYFQAVSPDVSTYAQTIIIYDEHRLSVDSVRLAIRQHGYHSYRVVDKLLDHKPEEKDLKF